MLLSKWKKSILISVFIILAVAGTFFAIRTYQHQEHLYQACTDIFLQTSSSYGEDDLDSMLRGEGEYGAAYEKFKDDPEFESRLADILSNIIENPSEIFTDTGFPEDKQEQTLLDTIVLLEREGIYSEQIKTMLQNYLIEEKQSAFQEQNDEKSKANTRVADFDYMIQALNSKYYCEGILTEEEIISFYHDAVENAIAQEDALAVADYLGVLFKTGYVEKCFPDLESLVEEILAFCEVYALGDGTGAYYDSQKSSQYSSSSPLGADGMSPIGYERHSGSVSFYGDFECSTSTTSSYVPGLVDQKSKDKYNTSKTSTDHKFRGMSVDANIDMSELADAAEDGAEYILCQRIDGESSYFGTLYGVLMIGPDKLYAWDSYDIPDYLTDKNDKTGAEAVAVSDVSLSHMDSTAEGDFSKMIQQLQVEYTAKYSPGAHIQKAIELRENGENQSALELFGVYAKYEISQEHIYQMAVELMRSGQKDAAFQAACLLPKYRGLARYSIDEIEENFVKDFKADREYKDYYYHVYCRLMLELLSPLSGEEIRQKLIPTDPTYWKEDDDRKLCFDSNGKGERRYLGREWKNDIRWSISGDKLILTSIDVFDGSGKDAVYSVYQLFDNCFLLFNEKPYPYTSYYTLLSK